jgi:hypothetical protein
MEDIELKQARLVERLFALTMSEKITWSTEQYNVLHAYVGNFIIVLENSTEPDGTPVEEIRILNENWDVIERFTDDTIILQEVKTVKGFDSFYLLMEKLREVAARQARNIDDVIDNIMNDLDRLEAGLPDF